MGGCSGDDEYDASAGKVGDALRVNVSSAKLRGGFRDAWYNLPSYWLYRIAGNSGMLFLVPKIILFRHLFYSGENMPSVGVNRNEKLWETSNRPTSTGKEGAFFMNQIATVVNNRLASP